MAFTLYGIFPNYYDETWVSYTFMSLLENMASDDVEIRAIVGTKAKFVSKQYISAILPLRLQRILTIFGWKSSPENLLKLIKLNGFKNGDIAYLWLLNPPHLTDLLKRKGVFVVREMINCSLAKRREELRKAYRLFNRSTYNGIKDLDIENEKQQLLSADIVFCPSRFVKESVMAYGVPETKCIECSYGWSPIRLKGKGKLLPKGDGVTVLFAGTVDVRKGAPILLEAWVKSGVRGRLILAGRMSDEVKSHCVSWLNRDDVVCLGHVEDIGSIYRSADIFCIPTWEEGGPIVTIEAMSQGLPVIVTPMGTSGIFSEDDGVGRIVPPGDVNALADAIRLLADDEVLRKKMGRLAQQRAMSYTWDQVAKRRLNPLLARRNEWLAG